jgi:hypothetical protein
MAEGQREDAVGAASGENHGKLRVFISYSRDDLDFADQLDAALRLYGFETSLDRHAISGGEEWKQRLGNLIREADTVIFVLSQSSATSVICAWEVEEAAREGKRIIPVVWRALNGVRAPPRLQDLNYIFFYNEPKSPGSGFGTGQARLVEALNTNLEWLALLGIENINPAIEARCQEIGVIRLLEKSEHRLLRAVEAGQIPVSIAVDIAAADDAEVQIILQQAYEKKLLRGQKLIAARRLIEKRRRRGKGLQINGKRREQTLSSNALVRVYREDVDRKRLLIRKANSTRDRLIFVTEAVRKLLFDENFVTLLRAERLDTLPRNLAERMQTGT